MTRSIIITFLEKTQHGDGDITEWILWYANTLSVALDEAGSTWSAPS